MSAVNIDDYKSITETVQHYLDGARTGKGEVMKRAFHADATIFGYIGQDHLACADTSPITDEPAGF